MNGASVWRALRKATLAGVLTLGIGGGLAGCETPAQSAVHTVNELTAVSISYGSMDRSVSYSFALYESGEEWLFDAECFTDSYEVETSIVECVVSEEEKVALLDIIVKNDSIVYAESYKAGSGGVGSDTEAYGFCLTFSDGSQYPTGGAGTAQSELEAFFYDLAEKYS